LPNIVLTIVSWLFFTSVGLSFVLLIVFMTIVWAITYRIKRLDFVDVAWGLGFIIVTLTAFLWRAVPGPRGASESFIGMTPRVVACLLVVIWGARLALHILQRWLRHDGEDVRYQQLRKKWGRHPAFHSYVQIFLLQAVLIYIICLPIQILTLVDPPADGWLLVGSLVWLIGFVCESLGDWQLSQFAKDPKNKGKLLITGLWRYTRHPNYFGEVTQWWGIFIIGVPLAFFSPWYTLLILPSPLLITVLILKVSGVPLTEKLMSKREGWREYVRHTSKFLPLPPKKE
jgi:steroid 5-alpha reductase family enzyme